MVLVHDMLFLVVSLLSTGHPSGSSLSPNSTITSSWRADFPKKEDGETQITFTVALVPKNQHHLLSLLDDVSDPTSKNYGKYLTPSEVKELAASDIVSVKRILDFLGPKIQCKNRGDSLLCVGRLSDLAETFRVEFSPYARRGQRRHVATSPLYLPDNIRDDIAFVGGLTGLPLDYQVPDRSVQLSNKDQDYVVVPDSIRLLYNITSESTADFQQTTQGIAEFAGNNNELQSDLQSFGNATGLGNLSIDRHIGIPNDPGAQMTEASLDIQYLAGVSPHNSNWVVNSRDWFKSCIVTNISETKLFRTRVKYLAICLLFLKKMFELASDLINADERPSVLSVSYAWRESQQCSGLPGPSNCSGTDNAGYVNRTNFEFAKLGLLGVTVLVASGDSGCHGRTDKICLLNAKMHPAYPAASPYVTSVGGTQYSGNVTSEGVTSPICRGTMPDGGKPNCAGSLGPGAREVVASTDRSEAGVQRSKITSGGGFSNLSPRPSYQNAVVEKYLNQSSAIPSQNLFNPGGRGFPDVSALAHNFLICQKGNYDFVDGTSAATPTVAGLISMINSHRLKLGRPMVGFANPLLYRAFEKDPSAFNDVVEGSNRCTESGCLCRTGFGATEGWDAATGLGSINFGRLVAAIDAMDEERERATYVQ
eukprot:UC4_evm2s243